MGVTLGVEGKIGSDISEVHCINIIDALNFIV